MPLGQRVAHLLSQPPVVLLDGSAWTLAQYSREAALSSDDRGVQLGQNFRGRPMRLGMKVSPHFAHVLAVAADSPKIDSAFRARAPTLHFFLAASW
jgi:hypothetical protein